MTARRSAPSSVSDALREKEGSLSPAELRVARYLVSHPEEVVFRSAVQLAAAIDTSDATVIRTAKVLGFSGLPELKHVIGAELMMTTPAARRLASKLSVVRESDMASLLGTVIQEATERLTELARVLDADDVTRAVDALSGARRVVTFGVGLSATTARYLATRLTRIGFPARHADAMGFALADHLVGLTPEEALVIVAPGRPTVEVETLVDHAVALELPVVLVTDGLASQFADRVTAVVRAPLSDSGLTGETLTATVVCDALTLALATRHEQRATRTAKSLTRLRTRLIRTLRSR